MIPAVRKAATRPPVSLEGAGIAQRLTSRLANIQDYSTVDVKASGRWKRQPDAQFRKVSLGIHSPEFPCFIVETAFSQPACDVVEKAQSYIQDSNSQVQVILVLNIQHPNASDVAFSL
ncbi:hypothetical protein LY78DRAFT_687355 [Colletotrichum sublineola]|uniref:Uncharacterized protein n=1 Tax=Colletotrichum sublineola TaxID=1173701 RepID=A0A066XQF4_COLSU|nr:hypothetical protein LY78DRAFT_687355 [Colletotrichum sublineola]KDN71463.1 hypothetical protein CSUB01_12052 [Colletotrichum sublineola]